MKRLFESSSHFLRLLTITTTILFLSTAAHHLSLSKVFAHSTSSSSSCGHNHPAVHKQPLYYLDNNHDPFSSTSKTNGENNVNNNNRDANQQSSTVSWGKTTILSRNTTLVTNPSLDRDVASGNPLSCTSTNQMIFVGGQDSGFNCFDSNGDRAYQDFCRLFCLSTEVLNSTHKQRLDRLVHESIQFFQSQRLLLWETENSTYSIVSDEVTSCAGMSLDVTLDNANLLVAVTSRPTRQLGSITAFATACQLLEINNRPILIHLNVDPVAVRPEGGLTDEELKDQIIHQITHGLGFSNKSYPLLRHPDDPTKTYFEFSSSTYPTGPISSSATTGFIDNGNGNFWINQTKIVDGQKLYFKGPTVMKVAQNYFDCATLPGGGLELENGGGSERVTGVHWEKRLFLNELMIGTRSWKMFFSAFTLAFLHDTGYFYADDLVNRSYIDITTMNYGRSKGCNFLSQQCSQWPATLAAQAASSGENDNYFCSTANQNACGFDRSFIGVCNDITWSAPVPTPYQYFTTNDREGGQDQLMDYCPIYRLMDSGECDNAANERLFNRDIASGMSFGSNSRCFVTNVLNSSVVSSGNTFGGCFKSFCHFHDQSAYMVVGQETIQCSRDNEIIELFPPVRFNVNNFVPESSTDTVILSYNYHGVIQCSSLFSECQAQRAQTKAYEASPIKLANVTSTFPIISSVSPNWGDPTGGTTITIIGETLDRCTAAFVGGVRLEEFVIVNATAVRGKLGNVGTVYGGPNKEDGVGDALVELQCRFLEFPQCAQSGGCIVARTKGVFNYSFADPSAEVLSTGVFSDFFDSAAGKVVGIVMCVIVILVLIVVARICFKDGEKVGPKYEDDKITMNGNNNSSSNNNNNDNYQSPDVVDNINLNDDGFSPQNGDDDEDAALMAALSTTHDTGKSDNIDGVGGDQELEPVVVLI